MMKWRALRNLRKNIRQLGLHFMRRRQNRAVPENVGNIASRKDLQEIGADAHCTAITGDRLSRRSRFFENRNATGNVSQCKVLINTIYPTEKNI